MAKVIVFTVIVLLLAPFVSAQLTCDDTDAGPTDATKPLPFITEGGTVKTVNSTKSDFCIDKEGDNDLAQESLWLREFYCYAGKAKSKDYQCFSYGYTKCKMSEGLGRCIEGIKPDFNLSDAPSGGPSRNCGDDITQEGEDCDPPGKLCVAKNGDPGVCTDFCICIGYDFKSDKENQTSEPEKNISTEEINVSLVEEKENKTTEAEISNDTQKVLKDLEGERPLKFNESLGYKLTSGIATAFKHVFGWVFGLFGGN